MDLFSCNEAGVDQVVDRLLDVEIIGIFAFDHKLRDLGVGQGKIDLAEHIENNQFI